MPSSTRKLTGAAPPVVPAQPVVGLNSSVADAGALALVAPTRQSMRISPGAVMV